MKAHPVTVTVVAPPDAEPKLLADWIARNLPRSFTPLWASHEITIEPVVIARTKVKESL